jgi:hypothetical protein
MARLRIETAPEITVFDEAFIVKAAANATAPLIQFQNASGNVGNISASGVLTVASVIASSAGTSSTDLATRGYVESLAAGINWHEGVAAATTTALPSCVYGNGTAGVEAYLEASVNGAFPTIDGITVESLWRVLVKNQADAKQNGIYQLYTVGSESTKWKLVRSGDANNSIAGQVAPGDSVYVLSGTTNANSGYALTSIGTGTNRAIIIGTDNITWTLFAGAQTVLAGNGINKIGQTYSVLAEPSKGITVTSNGVALSTVTTNTSSGSNTTSFLSNISLDAYGRVDNKEFSSVSFSGYATLASPTFTGTVTIPEGASISGFAPLANATFTGTITLPATTAIGNVTATEIGYVDGVTSAIQTQIDLKAPLANPTFTGTVAGITKSMISLGNVDNTADTAKPVSTAQQTALDLKSNIASPTFTGIPTAPTANAATNTTQIATTAFVRAEVAALVNSAPGTLDTLGEIATSLANNASLSTTLTDAIGLKAPLASPTFTGTVTLPTGTVTSAMILDGTIANADISATAAIDQGKIADTEINAQVASYTLVLADKNKLVEISNASANTLTVPPNSSVAFPIGSTITILQTGAGQCTLTAGAGVTVNGTPGLKLRTTWSSATLIKRATDTWVALGDMVA